MANYRSKALRDSANGEACIVCGACDGTVVWAHSNQQAHGKSMGIKAHDLLGLYLCGQHHGEYDTMDREIARAFFVAYFPKTMTRLAEKLVAGELKL